MEIGANGVLTLHALVHVATGFDISKKSFESLSWDSPKMTSSIIRFRGHPHSLPEVFVEN